MLCSDVESDGRRDRPEGVGVEPNFNSVEGEALRLGVQFLYAQAGEVLKRRRERSDDASGEVPVSAVEVGVDGLKVKPRQAEVDFSALEELAADIEELQRVLAPYAEGERAITPDDDDLRRLAEGQRRALERVLGQDFTLRGEVRSPIGVRMEVGDVHGYVAGLVGRPHGDVRVEMKVRSVGPGATVLGADFTAGDNSPPPKPQE